MTKVKWTRKEHTTRGNDPTVVVTWISEDLKLELTEFQNVYVADRITRAGHVQRVNGFEAILCEELHKALESGYQVKYCERAENDDMSTETWRP